MDFTAIDFETANERRDSACQLGAVVVRGGDIIRRHCWLIRPRPMRFSRINIAVHGITAELVREEPDFGELWESIRPVLSGQVLVAHNARFDIGVLQACLGRYGHEALDLEFSCTRAVGHYAWPGQPGYGLKAIANRLGITFQHHDALEDAMACAKILLAAADEHAASSLDELEKRLRITRGRAGAWGCGGPRSRDGRTSGGGRSSYGRRRSWDSRISGIGGATSRGEPVVYQQRFRLEDSGGGAPRAVPADFSLWLSRAAEGQRLAGKAVAFTGLLQALERDEAERLVEAAGGTACGSVTRRTNLLVVGEPDARTLRAGRTRSTKEDRAEELRAAGQTISILSEREFLQTLGCLDEWVTQQKLA
ncbi:exonuclease domain-containing protein [Candidatus Laterigemmans baculatus]|uniref:exonuclease domain-containing protein n=1 Tax=Candidatus Laterigemmans baculatus TaxID=2770505 RepID=UPI0013DAF93B|nr:exonuclease domain-containing protein [Candidatus Laterigemmans baculatus]